MLFSTLIVKNLLNPTLSSVCNIQLESLPSQKAFLKSVIPTEFQSLVITSNNTFAGVAVIEIVREFSVSEIGSRVEARCRTVDSTDKHCAICNATESLLRCSRCKSVWYCGTKHNFPRQMLQSFDQ